MNTADIYDGMMRNMEFQARNDARLDAIYDREYKRQTNQMNYNNQDTARLNAIESRLSDIEKRLNKLQDMHRSRMLMQEFHSHLQKLSSMI